MTDEPKAADPPAPDPILAETPPPTAPLPADGKPAAMLQAIVIAAEKEAAGRIDDTAKTEDKAAPVASADPHPIPIAQPEPKLAVDPSRRSAPAPAPIPAAAAPSRGRAYAQAAAIVVALGLGAASGWSASVLSSVARARPEPAAAAEAGGAAQPLLDRGGAAFGIRRAELETARMATELRALRTSLDGLKDSVERARGDQAGRLAQMGERLDRAGRAEQEVAHKLAALSERLEGPGKMAERAERTDRQAGPAALQKVASAGPEVPAQTGSIAPALPAATPAEPKTRPPVLEGWVLRDVDDGVALIEGRNRRLVEVGPGDVVPGTGSRVESIERRGKSWLVVTSKGVIGTQP